MSSSTLLLHGYVRTHGQLKSLNISKEIVIIFWKYLNKIAMTMQLIESQYAQFGIGFKFTARNLKKMVIEYQNKKSVSKQYTFYIQRLFNIVEQVINDHLFLKKHIKKVKTIIKLLCDDKKLFYDLFIAKVPLLIPDIIQVIDDIMFMQFLQKSYSLCNLKTIYKNLSKYNTYSTQLYVEVNSHIRAANAQIILGLYVPSHFKQRILKSNNFKCLTEHRHTICFGYIRKCQINYPSCIASLISIYYQISMTFAEKMNELITNKIDSIPHNKNMILGLRRIQKSVQKLCILIGRKPSKNKPSKRLQSCFISRYNTHIVNLFVRKMEILNSDKDLRKHMDVLVNINKLVPINSKSSELFWEICGQICEKLSKVWSMQYILNEISLTDYTKKMENYFEDKCYVNFRLESMFDKIMIPIYIQIISLKYDNKYELLVKQFNKCELKQVYELFKRINTIEAKKLNYAFMGNWK